MTAILASKSLLVLEDINISSFNFDSSPACQKLTQIIDRASALTSLSILNQTGTAPIYVDITYASESEEGEITNGSITVKTLND